MPNGQRAASVPPPLPGGTQKKKSFFSFSLSNVKCNKIGKIPSFTDKFRWCDIANLHTDTAVLCHVATHDKCCTAAEVGSHKDLSVGRWLPSLLLNAAGVNTSDHAQLQLVAHRLYIKKKKKTTNKIWYHTFSLLTHLLWKHATRCVRVLDG